LVFAGSLSGRETNVTHHHRLARLFNADIES